MARTGRKRHLDVSDAGQYGRATDHVVREEGFRRGRERPREHDRFVQPRLLRTGRFEQPVYPRRIARGDKTPIAIERLGFYWARDWLPSFERAVGDGPAEPKRAQPRAA